MIQFILIRRDKPVILRHERISVLVGMQHQGLPSGNSGSAHVLLACPLEMVVEVEVDAISEETGDRIDVVVEEVLGEEEDINE